MKVLQISKHGLPIEAMELVDISEPDAPKAGGLLAAEEHADLINLWRMVMRAIGRLAKSHGDHDDRN